LSILSITPSEASVERIFSRQNRLQTSLRNRLSLETINASLCIVYNRTTDFEKRKLATECEATPLDDMEDEPNSSLAWLKDLREGVYLNEDDPEPLRDVIEEEQEIFEEKEPEPELEQEMPEQNEQEMPEQNEQEMGEEKEPELEQEVEQELGQEIAEENEQDSEPEVVQGSAEDNPGGARKSQHRKRKPENSVDPKPKKLTSRSGRVLKESQRLVSYQENGN
jgi:hypothetical protein